jgi:tripartite-type tricarboxylate transporter receptor subunit TctC
MKSFFFRQTLLRLCVGATVALTSHIAMAQTSYPDKAVRWVVPFPPGGAMDGIARALGEQISKKTGQPVVIENKAGAGGNIGVDFVAKAPADGYTMVITSIGMATNRYLYPKLAYDPVKDFAPVSLLAIVPNMLVVNPAKIQARNIKEFIAEANAKAGKLTYASAGNGTSIHLAGELFTSMTNTQMLHVPYRGSGPAINDLLGGQVDMMWDSVASARPHVQAGKLIALAVTTKKRSSAMPDVPTVDEAAVKGYELSPWFGVFMPAATPAPIIAKMNKLLVEAMGETSVKARLFVLGAETIASSPEALGALMNSELIKWEKLIRERNIKSD